MMIMPSTTTSARCSGLGTTKRRTELDCHLLSVQREYSERRSVRTVSEAGSMAGEVVGTILFAGYYLVLHRIAQPVALGGIGNAAHHLAGEAEEQRPIDQTQLIASLEDADLRLLGAGHLLEEATIGVVQVAGEQVAYRPVAGPDAGQDAAEEGGQVGQSPGQHLCRHKVLPVLEEAVVVAVQVALAVVGRHQHGKVAILHGGRPLLEEGLRGGGRQWTAGTLNFRDLDLVQTNGVRFDAVHQVHQRGHARRFRVLVEEDLVNLFLLFFLFFKKGTPLVKTSASISPEAAAVLSQLTQLNQVRQMGEIETGIETVQLLGGDSIGVGQRQLIGHHLVDGVTGADVVEGLAVEECKEQLPVGGGNGRPDGRILVEHLRDGHQHHAGVHPRPPQAGHRVLGGVHRRAELDGQSRPLAAGVLFKFLSHQLNLRPIAEDEKGEGEVLEEQTLVVVGGGRVPAKEATVAVLRVGGVQRAELIRTGAVGGEGVWFFVSVQHQNAIQAATAAAAETLQLLNQCPLSHGDDGHVGRTAAAGAEKLQVGFLVLIFRDPLCDAGTSAYGAAAADLVRLIESPEAVVRAVQVERLDLYDRRAETDNHYHQQQKKKKKKQQQFN
ncbi:hypothetical protein TYRP_016269 [Tyrophagus putrescentiae]|nr:hypothetical protein TYRP_016269 [Tyrophagus putrescentiae]